MVFFEGIKKELIIGFKAVEIWPRIFRKSDNQFTVRLMGCNKLNSQDSLST